MTKKEYDKYGNFITHYNFKDWKASTMGINEATQQNDLLKKCAAEFGLEFIHILHESSIDRRIKFGFSKISKN